MSTKTRADLVTQALANLGVIQAGQDISAEDAESVDGHVDGVLARLEAKGVVSVADDNEIPAAWFVSIAAILADDASPEFGQPQNPAKVAMAENDLRVMTRVKPTRTPLAIDYF